MNLRFYQKIGTHNVYVATTITVTRRVASQFLLVSPRDHFVCPVPSFTENERNCMKKSARVSEKLVSPGLPGLQAAMRLVAVFILSPWTPNIKSQPL